MGRYDSAESALADLPAVAPEIVLADINLPGLSGIECVRSLKARLPQTHFVMITLYEDADHIFDALAAGAVGYRLKRTLCEGLFSALKEVQAGGSPMSSNIARGRWQVPRSRQVGKTPVRCKIRFVCLQRVERVPTSHSNRGGSRRLIANVRPTSSD